MSNGCNTREQREMDRALHPEPVRYLKKNTETGRWEVVDPETPGAVPAKRLYSFGREGWIVSHYQPLDPKLDQISVGTKC